MLKLKVMELKRVKLCRSCLGALFEMNMLCLDMLFSFYSISLTQNSLDCCTICVLKSDYKIFYG